MAKITRRNFMKCAGVAALAVAAAGMMTSCGEVMLDVDVYFYVNGEKLPLTGKGKVEAGEKQMDTSTIEMPAAYSEQYVIADEKVEVIREDGHRYANVTLNAKDVTYQVYYQLDGKTVLTGEVVAAAVNPAIMVEDLNQSEKAELAKMFYQLTGEVQLSNNTVIVPVEKIMGEVEVNYYVNSLFGDSPVANGKYDEKRSVWRKETELTKDELMEHLQYISKDQGTYYNLDDMDDKFNITWNGNTGKVKVTMLYV